MVKIMAVYDEDPLYAVRLADYINQKERMPFTVMAFSDLEKLIRCGQEHTIAVLLVGERLREAVGQVRAERVMVLCGGELADQKEETCIYKYQSGDCIMREVMAVYGSCMAEPGLALVGSRARIMGIYSPVNRCMKTSLALTMGQILSAGLTVLYLSLESCRGFPGIWEENAADLSELFYLYRQGGFHWLKLKSLVRSWGNMDYVAPVQCGEDLGQMPPEEMAQLLGRISVESGYDRILVDVGQFGWGAPSFLEVFDVIYMPVREDWISAAKIMEFEDCLERAGASHVLDKLRRLQLPQARGQGRGENYVERLVWGEFGDYVRGVLGGGVYEE